MNSDGNKLSLVTECILRAENIVSLCKYLNYAIMHDLEKASPVVCAMENIKICNSAMI